MFIASGGIKVLVSMLQEYSRIQSSVTVSSLHTGDKTGIQSIINCMYDIFKTPPALQVENENRRRAHHPKRDFCRLFTKAGLLRQLVVVLRKLIEDDDDAVSNDCSVKIGWLLQTFASQSDPVVKKAMVRKNVLQAILRIITLLNNGNENGKEKKVVLYMLKTIRSLTDPTTIEELIKSKAVSSVCPFLASPLVDIQNQVIMCIFHMVRLKKECREEAALNGIIPQLQNLTSQAHSSVTFVFSI
eukprot:UN28999